MPLAIFSCDLLRKVTLVFIGYLVLFLFLASVGPVFATHGNDLSNTDDKVDTVEQTQSSDYIPIPNPQDQNLKYIPNPSSDPNIQQAQFGFLNPCGWAVVDTVCGAVGSAFGISGRWIASTIWTAVKIAVTSLMNFVFLLIAGVEAIDIPGLTDKIGVYQDGVESFSEIPNPGAIDYVGAIATETLELNVPVNSTQYFASINPFAEVQAQTGAEGLANIDIILKTWQRVRNVAYALTAVVLVIIGFLIMFRWKLDPRTSVTIQNSLPRIIISLILITFSFAIAGLMIDFTRLVTDVVMALVDVPVREVFATFMLTASAGIILAVSPLGPVGLGVLLILLIFAIVIFVVYLILIYKLLTRYVIFLLLTIFSPLFFLGGALPGAEGLVFNWFKRQAAALLSIPVTVLFVNLSFAIGFSSLPTFNNNLVEGFPSPWPVVGPLSVGIGGIFLPPLIGLGIFFFATKVPDIVDEVFGIKEMGARKGVGIGAFVGAPVGGLRGIANVNRAAPTIGNWAKSRVGTGGIPGRFADVVYKGSAPFAGDKLAPFGEAVDENKKARAKIEKDKDEGGPDTRWTAGRDQRK